MFMLVRRVLAPPGDDVLGQLLAASRRGRGGRGRAGAGADDWAHGGGGTAGDKLAGEPDARRTLGRGRIA